MEINRKKFCVVYILSVMRGEKDSSHVIFEELFLLRAVKFSILISDSSKNNHLLKMQLFMICQQKINRE